MCARILVHNAPCRRGCRPNPPTNPIAEDAQYETFVPERFGEALTADHIVLAADHATNKNGAIVADPAKREDVETTGASFLEFLAPNEY
eukprot:6905386-Pyramimonas_sp.AAC.1